MTDMMRRFAVALIGLVLATGAALAQSSPGLVFGKVPTPGEWNSYFAAKQDYLGFTPLNPSNLLGASPITTTLVGTVFTIGCPTCVLATSTPTTVGELAIWNNTGGTRLTQDINAALNAGLTLSPPAGTVSALTTIQTMTGTAVSPGGFSANHFLINDFRDADGSTPQQLGIGVFIEHSFGFDGTNRFKGHRVALTVQANQILGSGNNYIGQYVAILPLATARASEGGTGTTIATSRGAIFGSNPYARLMNGATNFTEAVGEEVDIEVQTGASVYMKVGLAIGNPGIDAVKGSVIDAMMVLYGASPTKFNHGILFGALDPANPAFLHPIESTGTIIATKGAWTVARGIDFSSYGFNQYAFISQGFTVDGFGNVQVKGLIIGAATSATGAASFQGITSGGAIVTAQAVAGSPTLTLPNTTGTLVSNATSPLVINATTGNVSCSPTCLTTSSFANPSASVGLTVVNGSATTAMRSDAAPPLSQSIAPTWTGTHTFSRDNPIIVQRGSGSQGKNSGIQFNSNGAAGVGAIGSEGAASNDLQILSATAIRFYTGSDLVSTNETMRLSTAGGLSIGTTTDPGAGRVNAAAASAYYIAGTRVLGMSATGRTVVVGGTTASLTPDYNTAVGGSALSNPAATGTQNTAIGFGTMQSTTTAASNTAVGVNGLANIQTASSNVAIGDSTLVNIVSSSFNTAVGQQAMTALNAANAGFNVAVGFAALNVATTGAANTAVGAQAMGTTTTGTNSVAIGYTAMQTGVFTGNAIIAIGVASGKAMTSGSNSVFVGYNSGLSATTGSSNVGIGSSALQAMTNGANNVAIGQSAGLVTVSGGQSVFVGDYAGVLSTAGDGNTIVGGSASGNYGPTTGAGNIILGYNETASYGPTTGSNNVLIGRNLDMPTRTASSFLSIMNAIYGSMTTLNSGTTVSVGKIGIFNNNPSFTLDVTGTIKASTALTTPIVGPLADSTTALQFTRADLSTVAMVLNTSTGASNWGILTVPQIIASLEPTVAIGAPTRGYVALVGGTTTTLGYIQWNKHDGTRLAYMGADTDTAGTVTLFRSSDNSAFMVRDITNKRLGINKTPGAFDLDVNGAVNFASTLVVSGLTTANSGVIVNSTPSGNWGLDGAASQANAVTNGGNYTLAAGAGIIIISDNSVNGDTAVYVVGGGAAALISQSNGTMFVAPTTTPAAGKVSIAYDGTSAYRIYNNQGGTMSFGLIMLRSRAAAGWLLNRDLDPAANDNTPAFVDKVA